MAPLLTPAEVAARWRVHPRTVRRLAERGELRGLRVGDLWRFRVEDVEVYEQASASEAQPTPHGRPVAAPVALDMDDLPADYEPVFPALWGREPSTRKAASSAGTGGTRKRTRSASL